MSKTPRLIGDIAWSIITQPLNRLRDLVNDPKTVFNRLCHKISHDIACDPSCCSDKTQYFPICSVHTEGHTDSLSIPAGNLEHIGTPPHITLEGDDGPFMKTNRTACVLLKQ